MSVTDKAEVKTAVRMRRLVIRASLMALYVALAVFVFLNGRGHTILLDNKSAQDGSTQAFRLVKVFVDNKAPVELASRDRDMIKVRGQFHRVRIETQEGAKRLNADIRIEFADDMILVSIPKMAAGLEDFWEPFTVQYEKPKADEAPPSLEAPVPLEPSS